MDKSLPLVSIILPTYNRAELLSKSIDSAISQTYTNWELIIWNDGSQDNTEKIISSSKDQRIKYYYDKNHGMSYALNNAIKYAQGNYLAFLDDDDQWAEYKLSHQMDFLVKNTDIDFIFGNFININLTTGEKGIGFEQSFDAIRNLEIENSGDNIFRITGNFFNSICLSNFIAFDTVIIRREIINKVGPFNENLRNGMDFEYWWRLALSGGKMAYANEIELTRVKAPRSLSSPSISALENTIRSLDFCGQEAFAKGRKDLVPYLHPAYRNAWQNMIPLYGDIGDKKRMLKAFFQSMRYGFSLGSIRLLFQSTVIPKSNKRMDKDFGTENVINNDAIRVLHVFAPKYKQRFGGPIFNWRYYFSRWNDPDVNHYVLDCENNQVIDSKEAFNFEYSGVQKISSRLERALWSLQLFGNLNKYMEEYDLLHVHILWWGSLLIGPWAKWKKIPALYESTLLYSDTPGGMLKEDLGRLKVRCLKDYRAILAISEYLAEDYRKSGFSEEQVFTLMNCFDTGLFSPPASTQEKIILRLSLNIPPDATILVFVGSVIARKGVDVLIQAFIEASSKRPALYLLIIGPKTKSENPSLEEDFVNDQCTLLKQNGLSGRVTFTGLIQEREKLAQHYQAADIFVFPSRNEGLSNVVLEAMASQLPVVVSQLPGLENVIKHEENGLFVPIGDAGALRNSILRLCGDAALARKIGHNARSYVKKNHGFISWQARLVEVYRSLISSQEEF